MTDQDRPGERLTVAQAADQLGISRDAIRSRLKRGTLRAVRDQGTVYVVLDADPSPTGEQTNQPTSNHTEQTDARDELIQELRDRVRSLEESNREHRRIIAGLVQRMPELESPERSEDQPHEPPEDAGGVGGQFATGEPENVTQRRSERPWWHKVFGTKRG